MIDKDKIQEVFLQKFPEYTSGYELEIYDTNRFGGFEIYIYKKMQSSKYVTCCYWGKEANGDYFFEKEEEINHMTISMDIDMSDFMFLNKHISACYRYNEEDYFVEATDEQDAYIDYNRVEKEVLAGFIKDNEERIKQELIDKIKSGDIKLKFRVSDTDCFDVPVSQIGKIYNV